MKRKNRLQAILEGRCPRCRSGKLFIYPVTRISKFGQMHDHCPVCDHKFEQEPGFYYGAMYVSYAVSVAIFLTSVFALYIFANDPPLMYYIGIISVVSLILYPFNFRFSRILFTHLFSGVKYDPEKTK